MAKDKKMDWIAADVKCPFYINHKVRQTSIRCEGFTEGTDTITTFKSISKREKYMGIFCVGRYQGCPIYRGTYKYKYGEDQEAGE